MTQNLNAIAQAKFADGARILINNNIVGIVLSSYNLFKSTHQPCFIYRVIVDAHELCCRVKSNQIDQSSDKLIFNEDWVSLLYQTNSVTILEVGEDEMSLYEGSYESDDENF